MAIFNQSSTSETPSQLNVSELDFAVRSRLSELNYALNLTKAGIEVQLSRVKGELIEQDVTNPNLTTTVDFNRPEDSIRANIDKIFEEGVS